jgi:hypothetical protein
MLDCLVFGGVFMHDKTLARWRCKASQGRSIVFIQSFDDATFCIVSNPSPTLHHNNDERLSLLPIQFNPKSRQWC